MRRLSGGLLRVLAGIVFALATNCGASMPPVVSKVGAHATSSASAKRTYCLPPSGSGASQQDRQFREFSVYLTRALNEAGFVPASSCTTMGAADLAIFLGYGIGPPDTQQRISINPTIGVVGVSTGAGAFGSTTYTPLYGVTGFTTEVDEVTNYDRFVEVVALDAASYTREHTNVEVWRTTVTSRGALGDLRTVVPCMLAAARPYLGKSSPGSVEVSLARDDEGVTKLTR